jgi:hypothetical protein
MSTKSRSMEETFADMHRELRGWNPDVPESPDRLDPVLKMMLQLYSSQLSKIDKRIDDVWDGAAKSLVKSLCPASKRWPIPAYTVMSCQPTDSAVKIDQHLRFFYKEKRDRGHTFFFSPHRDEKLIKADIKYIYLKLDNKVIDLSPAGEDEVTSQSRSTNVISGGETCQIYIAVDYQGSASDFTGVSLFLKGIPDALRQLRWAQWYPGAVAGNFYEDSSFCPGLTSDLEQIFAIDDKKVNWGGLRSSLDIFKPLEDSFIIFPEEFASTWELGPINRDLEALLLGGSIEPPAAGENFYWIRLDLPAGGDKSNLQTAFEIHFNCFVAVNKNELALFKHTGGNRLVEVELPEHINNILEITSVVDSNGRKYVSRHDATEDPKQKFYAVEERKGKLVLWFDFSGGIEFPPDSISLKYTITAGVDANGIEAGDINELYESHPGILSSKNIIPTRGAIPAKTDKQILTEVSARLRNRDRALSFEELANWATTFDPRIIKADCFNGVERAPRGVRRCIIVKATVQADSFYSDDELTLLKIRLGSFLKQRSPANTHFKVEVIKG